MKVLIGYDGSEPANAAINDLDRAGLPPETEVTVLAVANVWPGLPLSAYQGAEFPVATPSRVAAHAHELARQALADAREVSSRGEERMRAGHPKWTVHAAVQAGSPSESLLTECEKWKADLIVTGTHGRGALRRLILGSVSQNLISHAPCSVRIGRAYTKPANAPLRIVIGVDGSADSSNAVRAVARRFWPRGTEVHVVTALDTAISTVIPTFVATGEGIPAAVEDDRAWMHRVAEAAVEELIEAGLEAAPLVLEGDPKGVLLDEAEQWSADCIFVGAKGHSRLERFLIGSVSAAVAARAHCSVEVVRMPAA